VSYIPLSPQACERLIEEIDKVLERRTPTTAPSFVMQDELRAWLTAWKHDRELLKTARWLLAETARLMRNKEGE
jgi:hypothetical protein